MRLDVPAHDLHITSPEPLRMGYNGITLERIVHALLHVFIYHR